MVVATVTQSTPTCVEEFQLALEEIGKEVAEYAERLGITNPRQIREEKRKRVSELVARIKNAHAKGERTIPIEEIRPNLETFWISQEESPVGS